MLWSDDLEQNAQCQCELSLLSLSLKPSGFFLAGGVEGTSESYSLALPYPV